MAVTARRAVAVLWPVVLLALVIGTFRRDDGGAAGGAPSGCESDARPTDVPLLERCLALDPGDVGLMTDLGAAYESAGRADRAEQLYRRALVIDPHDSDVHVRLGRVLLAHGDRIAARAEGEAAARWHPGGAAARGLLDLAGAGNTP